MHHRRRWLYRALLCLALLAAAASVQLLMRQEPASASHDTPTLPGGFTNTTLPKDSTFADPIGLAFAPDGRLFVTTRQGYLRIYKNDALLPTPALDLSRRVCSNNEQGLLGVAFDPAFATNRFIYVYYTFNKFQTPLPCPKQSSQSPVNRVSRFTISASNPDRVDPASEVVLIDNIPATGGIHNAGDLQFGKDGYLYISVGDGGCDYVLTRSGCGAENRAARDQHVLVAKILRVAVTADGRTEIPASNPFRGPDSARCAQSGGTEPGKKCQETFAWGLRNPFRMAFDPNTTGTTTRFFINDVGQGAWEEIDEGQAGADYGWSDREGRCARNSTTNCGAPPAGMTNPIYDYDHAECKAISGGAFIPNGAWPGYDGAYFFSDYTCGKLFALRRSASGSYNASVFGSNFGDGAAIVAMAFGPRGTGKALYYTSFAHDQVRRIEYTGGSNRVPTAALSTASQTFTTGSSLTVTFNGGSSSDPDNNPLTYLWTFGDGTTAETSGSVASHTYNRTGVFQATLRVRDSLGAVSPPSEAIRIDVGNSPPEPAIVVPSTSTRFRVGQRILLQGRAADAQDGTLPDSALTWEAQLVHNDHVHPFLEPTTGNNVPIVAPAPEDLEPATVNYLQIKLTARDSLGRTKTIVQDLYPNKVQVTLATEPSGLQLNLNGQLITTPRTLSSWEGYGLNVSAPAQLHSGQWYLFRSWSDGNRSAARTLVTPGASATYTATFGTGRRIFMPFVPR